MSNLTVGQVLEQVDSLLPNQYTDEQKKHWLHQAEGFVIAEITGGALPEEPMADDTVLTVPAPYNELYRHYVEAQIHYANAETDRCNNAMALWNSLFLAYRNFYGRTNAVECGVQALKLC